MKGAWVLVCACVALSACSSLREKSTASTVNIAGDAYVISQLTASTWTATAADPARVISGNVPGKSRLLSAIEQASHCKVTDSDYSRQGKQLDAQVDCGGRLKN